MRHDKSKSMVFLQISLGALLLDLFIVRFAFPQTSFFQGKTVTILESSGPGGVGSMRTKAVVPFLQKYIPGNPTVVIQYMDGGGGRKAANHLYTSVRPDGLTIGRMSTPFVMHSILGESGVLYDIDKVTYLGTSYSGGYHVFLTRKEAGLDSPEKLRAASGVRVGAQSVGHLIYISGRMFTYLIGLKQPKFVTGYDARELDVAIERGEIDARSTVADSMLHDNREWVDKGLSCYHTHRALDGVFQFLGEHRLSDKDIVEVDVGTSERAMRVLAFSEPETPYQAKYSMPYCIAAAVVDHRITLDTFTAYNMEDRGIVEARKKVHLSFPDVPIWPGLADVGPDTEFVGNPVTIRTTNGRSYSARVDIPRGDPALPLTDDELLSKYRDCGCSQLRPNDIERSVNLVLGLEKVTNIGTLMSTFSSPSREP